MRINLLLMLLLYGCGFNNGSEVNSSNEPSYTELKENIGLMVFESKYTMIDCGSSYGVRTEAHLRAESMEEERKTGIYSVKECYDLSREYSQVENPFGIHNLSLKLADGWDENPWDKPDERPVSSDNSGSIDEYCTGGSIPFSYGKYSNPYISMNGSHPRSRSCYRQDNEWRDAISLVIDGEVSSVLINHFPKLSLLVLETPNITNLESLQVTGVTALVIRVRNESEVPVYQSMIGELVKKLPSLKFLSFIRAGSFNAPYFDYSFLNDLKWIEGVSTNFPALDMAPFYRKDNKSLKVVEFGAVRAKTSSVDPFQVTVHLPLIIYSADHSSNIVEDESIDIKMKEFKFEVRQ